MSAAHTSLPCAPRTLPVESSPAGTDALSAPDSRPRQALARQDSLQTLLQEHTGLPGLAAATPEAPFSLRLLPAREVSVGRRPFTPSHRPPRAPHALLDAGPQHLYLRTTEVLGVGGNAAVYLGIAVGTGELVALKETLRGAHPGPARNVRPDAQKAPPTAHDPWAEARNAVDCAQLMANAASALAPHALLKTPRAVYSVESLHGQDLHTLTSTPPPATDLFSPNQRGALAVKVARDTLPVLIELHAEGLMHGDLKPLNIMQRKTRIVLTDYNLASTFRRADYLTTAPYSPPEALWPGLRGHPEKFDVWCFGASLLQIAGGRAAWNLLITEAPGDWHMRYAKLHADLAYLPLAGPPGGVRVVHRKGPVDGTASKVEARIRAAFLAVRGDLRNLILDLMHPQPSQRPQLQACQAWVDALASSDTYPAIEATKALAERADLRVRGHAEPVKWAKMILRSTPKAMVHVKHVLGEVPSWVDAEG